MKEINLYLVDWDNGHASGVFPKVHTSKRDARHFGTWWKREMVLEDEDPKSARQEYEWDIRTMTFYVEKDNGAWMVYTKPDAPRSPIVKECPYRHVIPSLVQWVKEQLNQNRLFHIMEVA